MQPTTWGIESSIWIYTGKRQPLVALGIISDYKPRRSAGRRRLEK